jgi:hypothetical protein
MPLSLRRRPRLPPMEPAPFSEPSVAHAEAPPTGGIPESVGSEASAATASHTILDCRFWIADCCAWRSLAFWPSCQYGLLNAFHAICLAYERQYVADSLTQSRKAAKGWPPYAQSFARSSA